VNFAGWVLRNLGAAQEALDHHTEALEVAQRQGTAEVTIAALEDLAEQCLDAGDAEGAQSWLAQALAVLQDEVDLVFGWRLELKHRLLAGRLALLRGDAERALADATGLESRAAELGVPRYTSVVRLLRHRASRALGQPVDAGAVAWDLDMLDASVAIEAWWWTGEVAAAFGNPAWLDRAADRAGRLALQAGGYADGLRRAADQRLQAWRSAIGLSIRFSGQHHHGDHQRFHAGDGTLRRAPQLGPARRVQRAHERGDVGHAQPPRRQLRRGRQPGRDGQGAQPHAPEAGRRRQPGEHLRVLGPRLGFALEPHVPVRGAVAERAERLIDRRPGRMAPARRERAGGDGPADPPRLAQARLQVHQVAEGDRGQDKVEAAVAERQRGPAGHPGARAQVEHRPAGRRHR
jgi:hypothetical protein